MQQPFNGFLVQCVKQLYWKHLENIPDCGHFVPSSLYGGDTRPEDVTKVSNTSQDDLFCTSLVKSHSAWLRHD